MTKQLGTFKREGALFDRLGFLLPVVNAIDRPLYRLLLENSRLQDAHCILEVGAGTGYLAEAALSQWLSADATYVATEVSARLVRRVAARLAHFGARASALLVDRAVIAALPSEHFDRVLCTYVLDCMSDDEIQWYLGEMHRVLRPGGLLCLLTISRGHGALEKAVMSGWRLLHRLDPRMTGLGRPISMVDFVRMPAWSEHCFLHASRLGMASDLTIASRH